MTEQSINLETILHIPIGTLAKYQVEDLYRLLGKVSEQLERSKLTRQWLESAISLKYEEQIRAKRMRCEKDTGIIHLEDGEFKITNEVPKKVEWNQEKLAKLAANIMVSGGKLAEYIDTYYSIPESRYNSWSGSMKGIFEPARTLKLGKPTYKLIRLEQEAGL